LDIANLLNHFKNKEEIMSHENIIRAWKDEKFRNSLNEKERELLPECPVGLVELNDAELLDAAGGRPPQSYPCSYTPYCD
jgi:mersacidin/lichenicidin family type 2 lantibiotic